MKYIFFLIIFFLPWRITVGRKPVLLPLPRQVSWGTSDFLLNRVRLEGDTAWKQEVKDWLEERGGVLTAEGDSKLEIRLVKQWKDSVLNPEEAYRLVVRKNEIVIEASAPQGIYWAVQTLRQLTVRSGKGYKVRGCEIFDWPAFRIRGFMHDVGRGYLPLDELKHEIEKLSRYKINVFHWHLTEDLAWRLESRVFPMLNDSVHFGRYPGKYYTLEEARKLVHFCREHNVLLIPEVDMPGHSAVFRKAFRHDMQSREGMIILKVLLDEVCETFKEVPYIHIGTDEVVFTNPDFVKEMVAYIRAKGKKVVSWNPGWSYKTGEIDMLHMWSSRGKPHPGIPVIDSRLHYVNHFDAFADIVGLFNSNIGGVPQGNADFAGAILAVWNDRKVEPERNILLENAFYPAMLTLAERSWRGGGEAYFYDKGVMLDSEDMDEFADFEHRMLWHKQYHFQQEPFAYVRQTNVKWRITDAFPNEGKLKSEFPPESVADTVFFYRGKRYASRVAVGAGIYLRHVWGPLVPAFYTNPQPEHTAYAWTWVYSPKTQQVGLWACTQNYGRSEKDLPPPAGKWDYRESCLWINGNLVASPEWTARHRKKDNEIALGNENFEVRSPIAVTLNKGWNKVMWKLPVGAFSTPEVRLVKWMFTTVFVTLDGREAVKGLVYDPDWEVKNRKNYK